MIALNLPVISTVSAVSHTETLLKKSTEVTYGLILTLVSIAAVIVGVVGYAYTAFRLWQVEHGEQFAADVIRVSVSTIDYVADLVSEAYIMGREARALVASLQAG